MTMEQPTATALAHAWQAALDSYNATRAAETTYDDAVWTPAYNLAESGGPAIPDEVEAEMERLQTARMRAEDVMMDTPSSTLATVIFKIETARRRWEDFCFPDSVLDIITADLRRIEGEG
jgi:ketosteroid isomerase-like protein